MGVMAPPQNYPLPMISRSAPSQFPPSAAVAHSRRRRNIKRMKKQSMASDLEKPSLATEDEIRFKSKASLSKRTNEGEMSYLKEMRGGGRLRICIAEVAATLTLSDCSQTPSRCPLVVDRSSV